MDSAQVRCEGCVNNPRTHSLRCIGTDASLRPILYHNFGQARAASLVPFLLLRSLIHKHV